MISIILRKQLHQNQLFLSKFNKVNNLIRFSSNNNNDSNISNSTENDQLKKKDKISSNEDYFRKIATFSESTEEFESLRNKRYIEKSKQFAHDVINNPNKPSFGMIKTKTSKRDDTVYQNYAKKSIRNSDDINPEEVDLKSSHENMLSGDLKEISRKKYISKKPKQDDRSVSSLEKQVYGTDYKTWISTNKNSSDFAENNASSQTLSQPRDWEKELNTAYSEKAKFKIEKNEFFAKNRQKINKQEDRGEYKLNRKKHKNIFAKEKRDEFKKQFIENKNQDREIIQLNSINQPYEKFDDNNETIKNIRPALRPFIYNLAHLVKESEVLQFFVKMGVMIKKWDTDRELCEFIIKLDLERDIKPHLIFLHELNIPASKYAYVIENNPHIFKEKIQDLETRIEYLKSKRFSNESIVEILTRAPRWLRLSVEQVDTKLGWIQKEFSLTGNELRDVIISKPKLVTLPLKIVADVRFCLKDFLSFNDDQIKSFMIRFPKLFTKDFQLIETNYNYLTNVIKLNNEQISTYVPVLQTPLNLLRTRYAFLVSLNRIQFDVAKPNFISIKNMVDHDESKFLKKYAKATNEEYQNFLKTI